MASNLDKIIILTIGFIFTWFTTVTFIVFHHTSSSQPIHHLFSSVGGDDGSTITIISSDDVNSAMTLSQRRINLIRQVFLPKEMTSTSSSIDTTTTTNDNHDKTVQELAKENQIKYKIPFPQSIHNEDWEVILHPAEEMVSYQNKAGSDYYYDASETNNKDETEEENVEKSEIEILEMEEPHTESKEEDIEAAETEKDVNNHQQMKVPPFWNPSSFHPDIRTYLGNYGERIMTLEEASRIGSFTRSKERTVFGREEEVEVERNKMGHTEEQDNILEEEDSPLLETIYVAISSYRDSRCPHTVKSIFSRAKYPERIRVGIVDQLNQDEEYNCAEPESYCKDDPNQILCKYQHLIDVYEMNATLAVGPVFARHIGSRMYRGEYFTMQTDAHMEFVNGWDVSAISQWKAAKNEMAVLTTYVSSVETHYDPETGLSNTTHRPYMCVSEFSEDYYEDQLYVMVHGQQPEETPDSALGEDPMIQPPFYAAGFSFARGHFSIQIPYDQYLPMIFQGEEINIGLRAFTYGYDLYAPTKSFLFHYYSTDPNGKKRKVETFWEHA